MPPTLYRCPRCLCGQASIRKLNAIAFTLSNSSGMCLASLSCQVVARYKRAFAVNRFCCHKHVWWQVVVLDTRVPTRLAFFALVEHGVTAASIFDELGNRHVGMLTSTDLIRSKRAACHADLSRVLSLHSWQDSTPWLCQHISKRGFYDDYSGVVRH